jgi:hypothetical protein
MRRSPRGKNGHVLSGTDPPPVRRRNETFDLEVVHVRDGEDLLARLRVLAPFAVLADDDAVKRGADLRPRERRPGVPELGLLLSDGDERPATSALEVPPAFSRFRRRSYFRMASSSDARRASTCDDWLAIER